MKKKVIDFREEWIDSAHLFEEIKNNGKDFDEDKWLNKLIAWGETVFEIKRERNETYTIYFVNRPVKINIQTFEMAVNYIENKDWDLIRCVSALMANFMIYDNQINKNNG